MRIAMRDMRRRPMGRARPHPGTRVDTARTRVVIDGMRRVIAIAGALLCVACLRDPEGLPALGREAGPGDTIDASVGLSGSESCSAPIATPIFWNVSACCGNVICAGIHMPPGFEYWRRNCAFGSAGRVATASVADGAAVARQ